MESIYVWTSPCCTVLTQNFSSALKFDVFCENGKLIAFFHPAHQQQSSNVRATLWCKETGETNSRGGTTRMTCNLSTRRVLTALLIRSRRYTLNTLLPTNNTVSIIKSKLKSIQASLKAQIKSKAFTWKHSLKANHIFLFSTFLYYCIIIVNIWDSSGNLFFLQNVSLQVVFLYVDIDGDTNTL